MKELIKQKLDGRSQRWLCLQVQMTDVDMSNSLNGIRKFKEDELDRISKVLKIPRKSLNTNE